MKGVDTQEAGLLKKGIQRRDFFKLAAAGGAALAATSCASDPVETLVPFLTPPGDLVSGEFVDYASSCNECAAACGVIVRTREGRVINLEGNAKHPVSKGGLCAIGQSVVQENYSPARVLTPMLAGIATTWQEADLLLAEAFSAKKKIVWVTRPGKSATKSLIERWGKNYGVEMIEFETNPYQSLVKANLENFGEAGVPHYNIQDAATLVAFGADFLESWHSVVENSRAFADFRSLKNGKKGRFFHFSPHLSLTASNADKWYACPAGSEAKLALALASALLSLSRLSSAEKDKLRKSYALPNPSEVEQELGLAAGTLQKIAKTFGTAGKGLALAGGISTSQQENASLQAAVNLVNYLGNSINGLVRFGADYAFAGGSLDRLTEVLKLAAKGEIGVLVLDKVNLVHAFPDKQLVQQAIQNTAYSIGFCFSHNDTAQLCRLVLPTKTSLESWDVYHARSGVISLQQAAMVPLPQNLSDSVGDVLLRAAKTLNDKVFNYPSFQDFVQVYYKEAVRAVDKAANVNNEAFWVDSVMQGGFFKETLNYKNVAFRPSSAKLSPAKQAGGLRLVAFNSNLRNANALTSNRAWLDEIAPPISQLAWDSWVEIHPETAMKLNIRHGEEVFVKTNKAEWKAMAYVYHGVHKDAVAIPAGYGQKVLFPNYASRRGLFIPFTADNPTELKEVRVGENLSDLLNLDLSSGDLLYSAAVTIEGTGKPAVYSAYDGQWRDDIYAVVSESEAMYGDRSQKGRGMYRRVAIDELEKGHAGEEGHGGAHARSFHVKEGTPFDFYLPVAEQVKKENIGLGLEPKNVTPYHDPYRFEMVIDLDKCTGCSACVVACYAENNIPVVGKERVMYQRQMNWIRIERYFDPDENGEMVTNLGPNACQQCSNAGCEPVCPVYATYHNPDGLNAQVYNRCVGTRYCANNCIYKLRRFNWRTYEFPTPLNYQLNPDVTVRTKGVMEKCTFCVQRIRKAKETAKFEGRLVQDGEIRTACQSVCPTGAITFGNSVDKESQLSKVKESPRGYRQLEEVNFQPALTYLSRTRHKDLFQE